MHVMLGNIGSITTGVYDKGSPSGDTYYLQAKHFDEYGKFREDAILHPEIYLESRFERHLLKNGDLLIMAKGESNRVCLYEGRIGQAVASSTFFVIRLVEPDILSGYLQWYLNTSSMQSIFSSLSKGTHILSLSKKALMKVKLQIPSLSQQKEILKLQSLWEKERSLSNELIKLKEALYQKLLLNLTTSKLAKK